MLQKCDEDYWKDFEGIKPDEAPCGKFFDDLAQLTRCPHPTFSYGKQPQDPFFEFRGRGRLSRYARQAQNQGEEG